MTETLRTIMREALVQIALGASKGQRREIALTALSQVDSYEPGGPVEERVQTSLELQWNEGYKKGYAAAKAKVVVEVATGGQWATPIDVVGSVGPFHPTADSLISDDAEVEVEEIPDDSSKLEKDDTPF